VYQERTAKTVSHSPRGPGHVPVLGGGSSTDSPHRPWSTLSPVASGQVRTGQPDKRTAAGNKGKDTSGWSVRRAKSSAFQCRLVKLPVMSLFSIPVPEFSLAAALSNHTMALASTSFLYDLVVCQLQLRLLLHFSLACALFFLLFPTTFLGSWPTCPNFLPLESGLTPPCWFCKCILHLILRHSAQVVAFSSSCIIKLYTGQIAGAVGICLLGYICWELSIRVLSQICFQLSKRQRCGCEQIISSLI